jgi:uncharacterized protein YkuJ
MEISELDALPDGSMVVTVFKRDGVKYCSVAFKESGEWGTFERGPENGPYQQYDAITSSLMSTLIKAGGSNEFQIVDVINPDEVRLQGE